MILVTVCCSKRGEWRCRSSLYAALASISTWFQSSVSLSDHSVITLQISNLINPAVCMSHTCIGRVVCYEKRPVRKIEDKSTSLTQQCKKKKKEMELRITSIMLMSCKICGVCIVRHFLLNRLSPWPMWSHSNSCSRAEKCRAGALKINALLQIAGLNEWCDAAMIAA